MKRAKTLLRILPPQNCATGVSFVTAWLTSTEKLSNLAGKGLPLHHKSYSFVGDYQYCEMSMIDVASCSIDEDNAVQQWLEYLPSIDGEVMSQPSLWERSVQDMQNNLQESPSFADCLTQGRGNLSPMMKTATNESDMGYQMLTSFFNPSALEVDDDVSVD